MAGFFVKKSPVRGGITPESSFVTISRSLDSLAGRTSPEQPKAPEGAGSTRGARTGPLQNEPSARCGPTSRFHRYFAGYRPAARLTVDDTEQVEAIYGPVHSRLLKQARSHS